jgi:hypothetical protein
VQATTETTRHAVIKGASPSIGTTANQKPLKARLLRLPSAIR